MSTVKIALQPALPSDRSFGLFCSALLLTFFGWHALLNARFFWEVLGIACGFLALACIAPRCLRFLNAGWFYLGRGLHRLTNPLLMGIIFFGILTPMALFRRCVNAKAFPKKFDPKVTTYWQTRTPPGPDPQQLSDQF